MSLDKVATVAVVVLCGTLVGETIYRNVRPEPKDETRTPLYQVGRTFPEVPGFSPRANVATLVMYLRDGCRFCAASMPFYQQLAELVRVENLQFDLVTFCPQSTEACARYVETNRLPSVKAVGVSAGVLRAPGTPTLILIDEDAKVEAVWAGQLSESAQGQVIKAATRRQQRK